VYVRSSEHANFFRGLGQDKGKKGKVNRIRKRKEIKEGRLGDRKRERKERYSRIRERIKMGAA
jgi:hypothetical protein